MTKTISRRDFLKVGCLTGAAAGLATCGVAGLAASGPEPAPVDLSSSTYGENPVKPRILVTYASLTGSTAEIAAEIGKTISAQGFCVDVRPALENPSVDRYQAVVVGSAIKFGSWLPEAVDFIKNNQEALGRIPVALFCVHIRCTDDSEASRQERQSYMNEVSPLLHAVSEGHFAGRFNRQGAALLVPGILAGFVPTLDFRDWDKIRLWAEQIQPQLVRSGESAIN
ncbi:MAG: twin-arginine translocation signal domain-containing protein [Chloroflexota bacterium]|nr:MAG: twin-arginine translocation signal domain-containing protein [Chloroflexota bacterium]